MASLVIAISALVLSAMSFAYSRRKERREVLLRLFDHLVDLEVQRGRRHLYEQAERSAKWWQDSAGDAKRDEINRSLALFDTVGYYVRQRFVGRSAITGLWGGTIAHTWEAGMPYIQYRRVTEPRLWQHFEALYERLPPEIKAHYKELAS